MPRPKLKDVLENAEREPAKARAARKVSADEARVLADIGMSGALINEKARRVVNQYLESVLEQAEVTDADARAALVIMRQSATSTQRTLADKVITKYLDKFDVEQPVAA